jgi:hypothetical protein
MNMSYEPTPLRGLDLLDHVMALVEAEAAAHQASEDDEAAGLWSQKVWGELDVEKLQARGVPPEPYPVGDFFRLRLDLVEPEVALECGTAFCFAGHTVLAVGDRLTGLSSAGMGHNGRLSMDRVVPRELYTSLGGTPSGYRGIRVPDRAAELLDIDYQVANALFEPDNTLADLRTLVAAIHAGTVDDLVEECEACGEYLYRCSEDGKVCNACEEHVVDCTCCADCGEDACMC